MSEKLLWTHVKDQVGHAGHFDRIESHATANGRPDVNYCISAVEGDIELKVYDPRKGGFVLRASQNAWMLQRVRAGGRCFILARHDFGGRHYLLIDGKHSRQLIHDRSIEGWTSVATKVWKDRINPAELVALLTGPRQ